MFNSLYLVNFNNKTCVVKYTSQSTHTGILTLLFRDVQTGETYRGILSNMMVKLFNSSGDDFAVLNIDNPLLSSCGTYGTAVGGAQ